MNTELTLPNIDMKKIIVILKKKITKNNLGNPLTFKLITIVFFKANNKTSTVIYSGDKIF